MDFRSGRIDVGEERNFGGKLAEVDVEMGPGRSIFQRKISIFKSIHFLAKRCHLQSVKSISVYFFLDTPTQPLVMRSNGDVMQSCPTCGFTIVDIIEATELLKGDLF